MSEVTKTEEKPQLPTTEIQKRWQEAQYLATSDLLPKHFAGKVGNEMANCTILGSVRFIAKTFCGETC